MADAIGNIMSRMGGLKNVGKRRVMQPPEYMEETSDFDGREPPQQLPEFSNFLPKENMPQAEMGAELTPQSYDVRANEITAPEEDGIGASLRKLGANLWNNFKEGWKPGISEDTRAQLGVKPMAQTPPVETAQVDRQEGLPPVTASEEESSPVGNLASSLNKFIQPFNVAGNLSSGIKDYVKGWQDEGLYGRNPENEKLIEEAQVKSQGLDPLGFLTEEPTPSGKTQFQLRKERDEALKNPSYTAIYGSTDEVANQPELNAQFQKITGIDFNPQIAQQTKEYERVLSDIDNQINMEGNGYTEQEQRIKQRILDNQATDADKLYIGMALLMPLIVGAFFGKEAALGALGGGAKGIADIYAGRKKEDFENEKLLADIGQNKSQNALKKSEIELKRLGLPAEIQKNLPKQPNEHLIGKEEVRWTDPATGEEKVGVKIKPGLVAYPEYVKDKEELKEIRKEAQDISEAVRATKEINKLTGDVAEIASRMKDKNIFSQAFISILSGENPGLASKFGDTIEYQGRKVNSYVLLEHKLKLLVDAYRQAKSMRALTATVQEHFDGLFRNPAASFQSYEDTKDQMLYTRDLIQSRLMDTVSGSGFVPEFVAEQLQPGIKDIYNNLNTREGEKESSELLRG